MQKRKNQTNNRKKGLILIGSFLILSGICLVGSKYIYNYLQDKKEETLIDNFYEDQKDITIETVVETDEEQIEVVETPVVKSTPNYVAVIKIPKINLEKGICNKGTSCNNVNRNIQILNEADYPDKENGNFILAGHSGTGKVAYFKNLYKLELDDDISVFYGGKEYKYKVKNIYDIDKTGTADIVRNTNKTTLTLITCRQGTKKQIIFICELVEKVEV